jgi:hypothetical protein
VRTYGRVGGGANGVGGQWVEITTDANGDNSNVWLTTLCETLLLSTGESPFFGSYGIPATQAVIQQIFPDFYVARTQTQFAPYFASLTIQRVQGSLPPVYNVKATCLNGSILTSTVAL